jgi:hypothetical protein
MGGWSPGKNHQGTGRFVPGVSVPGVRKENGGMRSGQVTKPTPEAPGRIVAPIRGGAFQWVAATAAGIGPPATFFRWLQQGARARGQRLY